MDAGYSGKYHEKLTEENIISYVSRIDDDFMEAGHDIGIRQTSIKFLKFIVYLFESIKARELGGKAQNNLSVCQFHREIFSRWNVNPNWKG